MSVKENLKFVLDEIEKAKSRRNFDYGDVVLVAVTKNHGRNARSY